MEAKYSITCKNVTDLCVALMSSLSATVHESSLSKSIFSEIMLLGPFSFH